MTTSTMKSNLYKMIDSLPETSLSKAKRFLEGLLSKDIPEETQLDPETELWMTTADEDSVKALAATEDGLSKEDIDHYLKTIRRKAKPVKWDAKRKVFVVQKVNHD